MNPSTQISIERITALQLLYSSLFEQRKLDEGLDRVVQSNVRVNQVYNLVYGVARHHIQLNAYLNTKFKSVPPALVQLVLEIALFELIYNKSSKEYAVVNEALNLLESKGQGRLKGLANAILRNFLRNKEEETAKIKKFPVMPEWIMNEIKTVFADKAGSVAEHLLKQRPLFIAVNTNKISDEEFKKIMKEKGWEFEDCGAKALKFNDYSVLKTEEFEKGLFFVQDLASQLSVLKLFSDQGAGGRILDLCSAPGSKAIKAALLASGNSQVLALDKSQKRLDSMQKNLDRLGLSSSVTLLCKDAMNYEEGNEEFDYVIVDPPCSALGVIARHPDIIWSKGRESIDELYDLQKSLLIKGFEKLKKGGKLLYSVCTFTQKETVGVINNVQFELLDKSLTLPNEQDMDGHFIAIFRKDK